MTAVELEAHRGRLFGIAYRMLGSVAEAEDAVQEAFARLAAREAEVDDPAAWLTTVVTNVSSTGCGPRSGSARTTSDRGSPNRC